MFERSLLDRPGFSAQNQPILILCTLSVCLLMYLCDKTLYTTGSIESGIGSEMVM